MSLIYKGTLDLNFEGIILNSLNDIVKETGGTIEEVTAGFMKKSNLISDSIAQSFAKILDKNAKEYVSYNKNIILGFEENLHNIWGAPLDRFNLLIIMCREIGSDINNKFRHPDYPVKSYKLEVSTRIHAHAVHLASEIFQLLKGGFADGAMARWRSLHECAVIIRVIAESPEVIAEKYYHHKTVDDYKFSQSYREHYKTLGFEELNEKTIMQIKIKYDELIDKYGVNYANDNGWANDVFSKKKVTFFDLEEFSELGWLRPFYKFSSVRVHLGSKSLDYKLSLSLSSKFKKNEVLISGPSNEGLIDPMQCTALSLIYVTTSLMSLIDSIDHVILGKTLELWNKMLQRELVEAEEKLKRGAV